MKKLLIVAAGLALTACGELKEFAQPYKLDSVSFVETGGRVSDLAVKPADERVTITASMNGTTRSGSATANGVMRTTDNKSVLGAICPGENTVTYDLKVLGRSLFDAPQTAKFNYDTATLVMTGQENLDVSSAGNASTATFRFTEDAAVVRCGVAGIEFEQVARNVDDKGVVTLAPSTDLKLTGQTFTDATGRGVNINVVGLISKTYIVTVKVKLVNGQVISSNLVVRVS